ncbi:hypothetical protein HWV62_11409 [Athelia sp. TMB]|nr:hypothetical protein HWV62_11409 [Athelia sp. TMB]
MSLKVHFSTFRLNIQAATLGFVGTTCFLLLCLGGIQVVSDIVNDADAGSTLDTSLGTGINTAQGVFIEMFMTTAPVLAVLMLAAEKHWTTPFVPVGIGLTPFASHILAVYYSDAGLNTARSFVPAAVTGFGYSEHWIYWVSPFLGSVLGATIYTFLKHYHYYELTPDQAAIDYRKSPGHPIENARSKIATGSVDDGGKVDINDDSAHHSDKPLNWKRINDSPV